MKPAYIAFEGIDACGKGTQAQMLAEELRRKGVEVVLTREPVSELVGKTAKSLSQAACEKAGNREGACGSPVPSKGTYALVFAADRSEHVDKVVNPSLSAGKTVVSDRCYLSSIAFQTVFDGIGEKWIREINSFAPKPDVIFLLDMEPREALKRVEGEERRLSNFEVLDKQVLIRRKYLELAKTEGCIVIDASKSKEDVFAAILSTLKGLGYP